MRNSRFVVLALLAWACDAEEAPTPDAALSADAMNVAPPPRGDIYVPPPPAPDSGPPESDIQACSAHMVRTLGTTSTELGCDDYNELQRNDGSSAYHREEVVSACIQLSCEGRTIEGHNGIPAVRSCADLNELQLVIRAASASALQGDCAQPSFKVRIIPIADFVGGESCDQFFCTVGPDGTLISQLE